MSLKSKLESILFISIKPLSAQRLSELTGRGPEEVTKALEELIGERNVSDAGIVIQKNGSKYQMVTAGEHAGLVSHFIKEETTGELTQPQLETLTVIAYRGPVTKTELELIRGVNCSLILRNLLMRGLIEEKEDKKLMTTVYSITFDFMRFLGITDITQLPDYQRLNADPNLAHVLVPKPSVATEE